MIEQIAVTTDGHAADAEKVSFDRVLRTIVRQDRVADVGQLPKLFRSSFGNSRVKKAERVEEKVNADKKQ